MIKVAAIFSMVAGLGAICGLVYLSTTKPVPKPIAVEMTEVKAPSLPATIDLEEMTIVGKIEAPKEESMAPSVVATRPEKKREKVCEDDIIGYTDSNFIHPRLVRSCRYKDSK